MHVWRRFAWSLVLVVIGAMIPMTAAAGNAPGDGCVPGTVWEDEASGVTYICIYDELYGGTRWDVLPTSRQTGSQMWLSRSSSQGCTLGTAALSSVSGGGGGNMLVRSYRWPCATISHRLWQPAGEIRARVVIQRYSGSWYTCRDSGYRYNTGYTTGWITGLGMGSAADCGSGAYRTWGYGHVYQVGGWRGASLLTTTLHIR